MKVIIDGRALTLYPLGSAPPQGGTELYVHTLAAGLAAKGHRVHVVCADLESDEERRERLTYWGPRAFPTHADVVVAVHNLTVVEPYSADKLVLASNGIGADLGPEGEWASMVDAVACFSQCHADLLCASAPVDPKVCRVTGLGVTIEDYSEWVVGGRSVRPRSSPPKVPGRIWVGNDPARGLLHVLDAFEHVRREVPEATLHCTYDFDAQFERIKWAQNAMAEMFWEMKRRLACTDGVVLLGNVSREQVVREQLEAQVHLWPSDPPNVGSQIHGLAQVEAAAAGCALVLSDVEAFPELFAGTADVLPPVGKLFEDPEGNGRRIDAQDYADVVVELMRGPELWARSSRASRALAERHTWAHVVDNWDRMLTELVA